MVKRAQLSAITAVLIALAGCASVPEPLRDGPQVGPEPATVQAVPEQFVGQPVRWGGVIAAVENGPNQTQLLVVARPLDSSARPLESDSSTGRFLARVEAFLDPVDYAVGREISVVGVVEGMEQRTIGAYPYNYPRVRVTGYHLWPLRMPPAPDPFDYPFYPYHRYPYGPYYPYPW